MPKNRPTYDEIMAARTPNGGWTWRQLRAWGVRTPPPSGWLKKLAGETYKRPAREPFEQFKTKFPFHATIGECEVIVYDDHIEPAWVNEMDDEMQERLALWD